MPIRIVVPVLLAAGLAVAVGTNLAQTAPSLTLAQGLDVARRYRVAAISTRRFTETQLSAAIAPSLRGPALRSELIGRSIQGRPIRAVTFGSGPTSVLLWSQMHGDESTATMALADIFAFLAAADEHPLRERLGRGLSVTFVPMLNPDGAELFQRHNAAGVDVNRDARSLATPEARALKALRDRIEPDFAFNLHDQSARTRAGPEGPPAAIALLAPPFDHDRSWNPVRSRARLLAAGIANALASEIPGRIARYDDAFNPRAFGDLMQQWGASTVLIESGVLPDDPEKQRLRALNVAAILGALDAIATGTVDKAQPAWYDELPRNTGGAYDVVVRGGRLVLPGVEPRTIAADVAINYEDPVARTDPRIREVGDLTDAVALDTIDASGLYLHPDREGLEVREARAWLRLGRAIRLELRRGIEPGSELVHVVPAR